MVWLYNKQKTKIVATMFLKVKLKCCQLQNITIYTELLKTRPLFYFLSTYFLCFLIVSEIYKLSIIFF